MKQMLFLLIMSVFLTACAKIPHLTNIKKDTCNPHAAYAAGVNDATKNIEMKQNYGLNCYTNYNHIDVQYKTHTDMYSSKKQVCLSSADEIICGYDCKESKGKAKCAKYPAQQCIVGNLGEIACGYNCKKSANKVKCADRPHQHCIVGNFGEIACGYDCKKSLDNEIKCAKHPYQKCIVGNDGKTSSNQTKCAKHRSDNCVIGIADEIKCGLNCSIIDSFGHMKCTKER